MRARLNRLPLLPLFLTLSLSLAFLTSLYRASLPAPTSSAPTIFASPLVSPAPPPTLSANNTALSDSRGTYTHLSFPPAYANILTSAAGSKRSGDLHACVQVNLLISGAAQLKTLVRGRVRERPVEAGELVRIPGGVPHVYTFETDSLMTEHWVDEDGAMCEYQAWFYKPFRDEVDEALAKEKMTEKKGGGNVFTPEAEIVAAKGAAKGAAAPKKEGLLDGKGG